MVDELNGGDRGFLSRFEASFSQTRDEVVALKGSYASLDKQIGEARAEVGEARAEARRLYSDLSQETKGLFGEFNKKFDDIVLQLQERSKINWQPVGLMITVIVAGIGLLGVFMNMMISPISYQGNINSAAIKQAQNDVSVLQVASASSTAADAASRDDRAHLNDRVQKLESEASDNRSRVAEERVKLTEIETQFCAGDAMRNLMHAHDMRIQSVLWQHDFKETLPTDNAYYPEICQRTTPDNGGRP